MLALNWERIALFNFQLWRFLPWLRLFRPKRKTGGQLQVRYRPISLLSTLKTVGPIIPLTMLGSTYFFMFVFIMRESFEPIALLLLCVILFLAGIAFALLKRAITAIKQMLTTHLFDSNSKQYYVNDVSVARFEEIERIFIEKRFEGSKRYRHETFTVTIEISAENRIAIGKSRQLDEAVYIADDIADYINKQIFVSYALN